VRERLEASANRTSTCSASATIVELVNQLLQIFDIFLAELLLLAEIRHERRDSATGYAIEEPVAFGGEPQALCEFLHPPIVARRDRWRSSC
jgi:hypothetical protein